MAGTSTFGGLEIARSGMMAYNAALRTTAHNVANIQTKGYSKQVANMTSIVSNKSSYLVQGNGVWVTDISRQRDEYYDTKYQTTQSAYSKYNTQEVYLKEMESVIASGIVSDSDTPALITSAFASFNGALSSLVGSPNNGTIRRQSVTMAQTFTEYVQNVANKLQQLQDEANTQIKTCVDQINSYAGKIASLNKQINEIEVYGSVANDLRDQRSVLIDELSRYCNVETLEKQPDEGVGNSQFYVYVNGGMLVDTYHVNELEAMQKKTTSNINDIEGCYKISWADGSGFNEYSTTLGGQLQALLQFRDGNNETVLKGTLAAVDTDQTTNKSTLTLKNTNCNSVAKLNIPASDGEITIGGHTYAYSSFTTEVEADGSFTYKFELKDVANADQSISLKNAVNNNATVTVGTEVDFRGVPYYMAQLNEFVRTYAQEFNTIQKQGYDLNGNKGVDFFNATVKSDGENFVLKEKTNFDPAFSSVPVKNADGTYTGSYYYMTALNFCVSKSVSDDPSLIAAKGAKEDGNDNADNLQKLSALKDDADMFIYGSPDAFIRTITSTVGVDSSKSASLAESQSDLLYLVDTSRKSISGVDEDEEGSNMLIFQQMLRNQYKALSVLSEVIDRLINETAV